MYESITALKEVGVNCKRKIERDVKIGKENYTGVCELVAGVIEGGVSW